ncbi:MAG: AmmeMemoRadiSam system radical SAM enzyme [Candidatus Eiseniibacteriota bacterium]|jgi:pyruvate formate lyase activating enzyme
MKRLPPLSRRRFLTQVARCGGLLTGACALGLEPGWLERLLGDGSGTARAAVSLEQLIARAPRARYWVSNIGGGTSGAGDLASCLACHDAADVGAADADGDRGGGASASARALAHQHTEPVIKCLLCARGCLLADGERGQCRARIHVAGELRTLVYGRPISVHVDPIEKKPFFHFLPGRQAFSLATSGCPLRCKFCQNWEISQSRPEDYESPGVGPGQIVGAALRRQAPIIAYTYNEPTVFTEYLTDIAREARPQGLRSVLVSCGFMTEAPLTEMCQVLDAIKIDLKGFSPAFYRDVCGAELAPVLRSIEQVRRSGVHLEIVNLVVPTLNDSDAMLEALADWVVGELGPDVPVHFTRFHPDYQMRHLSPTPIATLERARDLAMARGMHYAYVGNVPGHPGNHTDCPRCGARVITRRGFLVESIDLEDGHCGSCGAAIAGVWQ